MIKKILLGFLAAILILCVYATTRPDHFSVERSGVINAPAEKIFPYLNNFKLGGEWSPYERIDANMKKTYSGPEVGVGAGMQFAGNSDVGEGRLEILNSTPNTSVELRLEMLKPFHGVNNILYKLTPEGAGTRFSWSMSGNTNFFTKLIGIFMNCEKMIAPEFEKGIQNLKTVAEKKL